MNSSGPGGFLTSLRNELREHPEPVVVEQRLARLASVPEDLLEQLATAEVLFDPLLALLSLGHAPLELALKHAADFPQILDLNSDPLPGNDNLATEADLASVRDKAWLGIALREQTGQWTVDQSAAAYAELADRLGQHVLRDLVSSDAPSPFLFALGKWGGRELNACSDIDPVFFAPGDLPPGDGDRIVRGWTQRMSGTRNQPMYDVDLRLRPEGDAGPLAWALPACERYFLQRAAPWERVAWLRGRPVGGEPPPWFDDMLRHFLFAMGGDVHDRVRTVANNLAAIHRTARPRDLKRAPGGLRDIEFLVAALQLAEGRHDPELRHGSVPDLLDQLGRRHLLAPQDARALREAYLFLRRLEHAMQVERLAPRFQVAAPGTDDFARLAWVTGFAPEELEREWQERRRRVRDVLRKVLPGDDSPGTSPTSLDPQADEFAPVSTLNQDPRNRAVLNRLSGRWGAADTLFDPELFAGQPGVGDALTRLEASVRAYGGPEAWSAAFSGRPTLRTDISRLLLHGRRIVEEANQRPYLWERIGQKQYSLPEMATPTTLSQQLGDLTFYLGEAFLAGALSPEDLTAFWSLAVDRIAELLGRGNLDGSGKHPPIALLASGKWGGQELAPDGDLDLLYVCDEANGDGLAQAVRTATEFLTTLSLAGRLTPDARLRPEGSGAPICVTVSRLEDYLATRAAPWERMALVRARYVAGDRTIGLRAQRVIRDFASTPPPRDDLPALQLARKKASQASRARKGVIRIKKARGGMMDFEFACTFAAWRLQLPARDSWAASLFDRMRQLAQVDHDHRDLWRSALPAYSELRRWELVQSFSTAHRRGDVPIAGEEGERFAAAAGMEPKDVIERWDEISALGKDLYDLMADRLA